MKPWRKGIWNAIWLIAIGAILFLTASYMHVLEVIFNYSTKYGSVLLVLIAVICIALGKREQELPLWRKRCLIIGSISAIVYVLYWAANIADLLEQILLIIPALSILIPVLLNVSAVIGLSVYVMGRPSTWKVPILNILLTLVIIVSGGYPALYLFIYLLAASVF